MRVASFIFAVSLAAAAAPSGAGQAAYWEYGDWGVSVETTFGEEHAYTECRIATGGDGLPTLSVIVTLVDGEWREPPHIEVTEYAPRGMRTALRDGAETSFLFNDGFRLTGRAFAGFDDDGFMVAHAYIDVDPVTALRAMRRNNVVLVEMSPQWTQPFSLRGFTAAYGKIAEQCRFDPSDVIG